MGRPGRYTLAVMTWVAAYAGWSSIIGLVVAALTGDEARDVSAAWSALLTVIGPLVPTIAALWFNDWARDGFPTREQMRAARQAAPATVAPATVAPATVTPATTAPTAPATTAPTAPVAPVAPVPPTQAAVPVVADATIAHATVAGATIREAHPLGVPGARADSAGAGAGDGGGGFPVAPLVRD